MILSDWPKVWDPRGYSDSKSSVDLPLHFNIFILGILTRL